MNTDELRKLAEAAASVEQMERDDYTWVGVSTGWARTWGDYIAAVSPEVVLALLDRLERLDRDCDTCANKSTDGIYSEDCLMCRHYFGDAYEPRPEKNECAPSQD